MKIVFCICNFLPESSRMSVCPLKGNILNEHSSSNHQCSGDMLVFMDVVWTNALAKIC